MKLKPTLPKGMRDFGAEVLYGRYHIINTVKNVFEKYGFTPLETPTIENLSTLTGKYGDEGDALMFKILKQDDFLRDAKKLSEEEQPKMEARALLPFISDRGLRYDLTIPFARYVAMNQNDLSFPYKRYQIQPVWRGDKPQRGRYREFYQCDVDVVGSNSLINEAELIKIYTEVFSQLKVGVAIKLNNRKILEGLSALLGAENKFVALTVALDKLDKIGFDGVRGEMIRNGFSDEQVDQLGMLLKEETNELFKQIATTEKGAIGVAEWEELVKYLGIIGVKSYQFDITLARGLNYYTGTIVEVAATDVKMGSIGGGGRYDNLTGMFGLPNVSGVGCSFGLDRIYDVMEELGLLKALPGNSSQVLLLHYDDVAKEYALDVVQVLRDAEIKAEIYPDTAKMKKQMKYADARGIPYIIVIGDNEMEAGVLSVKDMQTGEQESIKKENLVSFFQNKNS